MARAESLTVEGACPSAQLIEPSAVALLAAVRDHFQKLIVGPQKQKPRQAGPGHTFKELIHENGALCSRGFRGPDPSRNRGFRPKQESGKIALVQPHGLRDTHIEVRRT